MRRAATKRAKKHWSRPGDLTVIILVVLALNVGSFLLRRTVQSPHPNPFRILPAPKPLRGITVLLDPGHGGTDSGVIRKGCREDAVNYRLAVTVAAALRAAGAEVVYTVQSKALNVAIAEGVSEPSLIIPDDARLTFNDRHVWGSPEILWQRAVSARPYWRALSEPLRRSGHGLYFLSLHHDEVYPRSVRGARVAFDRRDGSIPLFARILARRLSEEHLDAGSSRRPIPLTDPRRLGVLNPLYNPVPQKALLEAGTISNAQDRALVRTPAFRWRVARLVVTTVQECETGVPTVADAALPRH